MKRQESKQLIWSGDAWRYTLTLYKVALEYLGKDDVVFDQGFKRRRRVVGGAPLSPCQKITPELTPVCLALRKATNGGRRRGENQGGKDLLGPSGFRLNNLDGMDGQEQVRPGRPALCPTSRYWKDGLIEKEVWGLIWRTREQFEIRGEKHDNLFLPSFWGAFADPLLRNLGSMTGGILAYLR